MDYHFLFWVSVRPSAEESGMDEGEDGEEEEQEEVEEEREEAEAEAEAEETSVDANEDKRKEESSVSGRVGATLPFEGFGKKRGGVMEETLLLVFLNKSSQESEWVGVV